MTAHPGLGGLATASLSDTGRVRHHNEDCCSEFEHATGARLLALADGMGGHRGGATASRITVDVVGQIFAASSQPGASTLADALREANRAVHEAAAGEPSLHGMGTTAVLLLLGVDGSAVVAHIGDSRAYLLRGDHLEPLTADHSVVGEMLRGGHISAEEARGHARRNEVLRSVGVAASVEPEVSRISVEPGDCFILCSDGLSDLVRDEEIEAVLQSAPPAQAARSLIDSANALGGTDNVTVQIARFGGHGADPGPRGAESPRSSHRLRVLAAVSGSMALALIGWALWLLL